MTPPFNFMDYANIAPPPHPPMMKEKMGFLLYRIQAGKFVLFLHEIMPSSFEGKWSKNRVRYVRIDENSWAEKFLRIHYKSQQISAAVFWCSSVLWQQFVWEVAVMSWHVTELRMDVSWCLWGSDRLSSTHPSICVSFPSSQLFITFNIPFMTALLTWSWPESKPARCHHNHKLFF